MKFIIKNIRAILFSNLLIFGLTACSSEPAPWTRPDESPWSEKHAAEQASVEEVAVIEEPIIVVEPEPMLEPMAEPSRFEDPEPVVAAVIVPEPEPVPLTAEERIMSMDSGYAVQVFASANLANMDKFMATNGLEDMLAVKTDREGSVVYVLVSTHPDRASANVVAAELEQKTGARPWVRSILGLQKVVYQ
ncbi:MAG: SPOR domain-containing protein [Thiotrichales bacterium]|nr:MAG: SPOR domain-containing protein [Thiotrichales bacterium]